MRHYALEDGGSVTSLRANICVQVLEFDLLAPKVVREAAKDRAPVFLAVLAIKCVVGNALADGLGVALQAGAHDGGGQLDSAGRGS